jgi:zinc protease
MMRRLPSLAALAASLALAVALRAAAPFPQAESDLKADPAITFGSLPNGVRYAVMPNHEPKGRASLRLLVLAGSFDETEAQRGLAHYLEHMAFNGSTHYAPGTLVEKLQRLGMGFGADTNAATSFDHTIYQLEMPDTSPATIADGLQIFADYGGGLLLEQKMVDKERGIILSEKRTRDSVGYRTMVAELGFMESGTRIPDRLPIGLTDVIEKSTRDPFVDFYNTWYRPENLVVIVVGDVDGPAVEKQIVEAFSGLAARSPAPAPTDLGRVPEFTGVRALFHPEPESPDTRVVIGTSVPYTREADTGANRLRYLPRDLATDMLNQRLEILAKKENAPFISASSSVEESFNFVRVADIDVTCRADQWTAAMLVADQELRRALAFGFRPDELKEAVANFRNNVEQAVKTASTRRSEAIAGDLAESLVDKEVFTSPADDLALYGPALDKVTPSQCAAALKEAWSSPGRYVFVSGNARIVGEPDIIVQKAYARAEASDVKPTAAEISAAFAYTNFGTAGAIASRTHVDDLDITQVTFANGVRLNIKKTDFEAGEIHVSCRLGTGQLTEPPAEPGLSTFARLTYTAGGLGKHSEDDLQKILAGRTVGSEFLVAPDAFYLSGKTNKDDLNLELELLTANIVDPGYRPEAMRVATKRINEAYTSFEHTLQGPLALQVPTLLAGGDPRFGLPPRDKMMARNLGEVKAWLAPQEASGPLEVSLVGDVNIEDAIAAAARTFGTLPARDPRAALDDLRKVSFPKEPFTKSFGIDSEIPKGLTVVYYPTSDGMDIHRSRRLNILAEVFSDRLRVKVREQMGSSYAPTVRSTASDVFPGYGYLAAIVEVDPTKTKEVQDVVVAVAADLQANGATQDELNRSLFPTIKHVEESERTNGYWLTVLGRCQEKPEVLDWARTRRADFTSISKADMDALAKAYLSPSSASRLIIRPYFTDIGSPLRLNPTVPAAPAPPPADGM